MKGPSFNQLLMLGGLGVGAVVLYEIYVNQGAIQQAIQGALNPSMNNPYVQQGYMCPSGGTPSSTGLCPNGQPAVSLQQLQQQQGYGMVMSPYGPSSYNPVNQTPFPYNTNVPTGYGGLCSDGSIPNPTTGLCANGTFPSSLSPSTPFGGLPPPYTNLYGGGTLFAPGGGFGDGGWGGGGWGGWGGGQWNQSPFHDHDQGQPSGTMSCADGSTPNNGVCANGQAPTTSLPAGTPTTPSGTVPSTTSTTPTGTTVVTPNPTPPTPKPPTTTTTTGTGGTATTTTTTSKPPTKAFAGFASEGAMMAAQAFGHRPRPPIATATSYSMVHPRGGNMPMTAQIFNRRFQSRTPIYVSGIH